MLIVPLKIKVGPRDADCPYCDKQSLSDSQKAVLNELETLLKKLYVGAKDSGDDDTMTFAEDAHAAMGTVFKFNAQCHKWLVEKDAQLEKLKEEIRLLNSRCETLELLVEHGPEDDR